MSEQWWAVKVLERGIVMVCDEEYAKAVSKDYERGFVGVEVVPVRIVEDAEPCEWELQQGGDSCKHMLVNADGFVPMKFCPNCGRKL